MWGSERVTDWVEARELATSRAGRSGRAFADERLDAYLRANWLAFAGMVTVVLPFIVGPIWFSNWNEATKGFVLGVSLTALFFGMYHWSVLASGAAGARMGATAEQWTDMELRRLRRSGWRIVNHVMLRHRDIDHIVVGPDGVIVIETKWTGAAVRLDGSDRWLGTAVEQARENANDIRRVLGWHTFTEATVAPMVVVWGPLVDPASDELVAADGGVELTAGRDLHLTLDLLGHRALTDDQIDDAYRKITEHVARRDVRDADNAVDSKQHLSAVARRWLLRSASLLAGLAVASLLLRLESPLYFLANVPVVAVGLALRRRPDTRGLGLPWLIGSQFVTLVVLADVIVAAMN